MSTLQDLKQKQLEATEQLKTILNNPATQELQSKTISAFNEYRRLSQAADDGFKNRLPADEQAKLEQAKAEAQSNWATLNTEFAPIHKQVLSLDGQRNTYSRQISELAETETEPSQNRQTQFNEEINAVEEAAENSEPASPPADLPAEPDEDPLYYAAPNEQQPFVLSPAQTIAIERYNAAREAQGLPPIDPGSIEAIDLIIETGTIIADDDGFPVEQQTVNNEPGIKVTISGVGFEEFQDDSEFEEFQDGGFGAEQGNPDIDSQFTENFPQTQTLVNTAREQAVGQAAPDWRVRLSLAPTADYMYNAADPGILKPLAATRGVIFPYTPQITINYTAGYTPLDIVHTNYKFYSYKSSSVENVMITGDFTAQNTVEANYMLAVIHFFRSMTKMFYGQDQNPSRGVPPPLCYLSGYGPYQFDNHPVVITNFTYNLPVDVDYITAYPTNSSNAIGGIDLSPYTPTAARSFSPLDRLRSLVSSGISKGGLKPPPIFQNSQNIKEGTRVPTKINIQLSCLPIATRNAVSNKFSLRDYASGKLLRGSVNPGTGGGMW